jgi:Na+/melibiose symporter-like transporter
VGAGLSIVGLVALVYAIIEAPAKGWTDPIVLAAFGAAAVLIVVFLWWESRVEHPMLQLGFFENPRFSAASVAITLVFFAMFGTVFLNTQYLQFVLGYSPLEAGFRVMPVATMIVAAPLSARFAERFGTKKVVTTGLVIVSIAMSILATITVDTGYGRVALALAVLGLGMGTAMAPATESIMGSLPLAKAGVGSAMNDTTRQIGGALGVAILGSILASSYGSAMESVVASLPPQAAEIAGDSVGGAMAVAAQAGAAGASLAEAAAVAFVGGMESAVWVAAGVAMLGAIVTFLWLPARGADQDETALGPIEDRPAYPRAVPES